MAVARSVRRPMSIELAKKLRANPTLAERALWQLLWSLRTGGYHFRKQKQIGSYFVDFACIHGQLVIEVDGDTHGGDIALANDRTRDEYLNARGFAVLRFTNDDVLHNPDGVFDTIVAALGSNPSRLRGNPPPQPSPQGGGCDPVVAPPSRPA
ncbi:Very-short-patch-repair endonuclease [Devosia psychrophila]|uniref:Very-short-patch-repair endonuclease n=2 Tax=Devosia psychrophila TaxID=728005 RepID=A0A1I1HP95_9HYPH|nr:Very-short-patch-repair endonuclease [Devosia psychrophila]